MAYWHVVCDLSSEEPMLPFDRAMRNSAAAGHAQVPA
jgi:hypothetical protein